MKRLLMLFAFLLYASTATAQQCFVWGTAQPMDVPIFDFATAKQPYTGTAPGSTDCKLIKDGGTGTPADTAEPVLSTNHKIWTYSITDTEAEATKLKYWCLSGTDAYLFAAMPWSACPGTIPNGQVQANGGSPTCTNSTTVVRLAATETAADGNLVGQRFTTVKGTGSGQSRKICAWDLDGTCATLCEPLNQALATGTWYVLESTDKPFTTTQEQQINQALGLTGTKTAASGGDLQSVQSQVIDVKNTTDQITFTTANKVDATATCNSTTVSGFRKW